MLLSPLCTLRVPHGNSSQHLEAEEETELRVLLAGMGGWMRGAGSTAEILAQSSGEKPSADLERWENWAIMPEALEELMLKSLGRAQRLDPHFIASMEGLQAADRRAPQKQKLPSMLICRAGAEPLLGQGGLSPGCPSTCPKAKVYL